MTQEDKDLLLKDLCARLPHEIIEPPYYEVNLSDAENYTVSLSDIKPCLRPMSSMTEKEKEELSHLLPKDWSLVIDKLNNFWKSFCF